VQVQQSNSTFAEKVSETVHLVISTILLETKATSVLKKNTNKETKAKGLQTHKNHHRYLDKVL
jgi:hypothetical protein